MTLDHPDRRQRVLDRSATTLLLDVGANTGQHVQVLRDRGYAGRVISFEPVPEAYADLCARWGNDPRWTGLPYALGPREGSTTMHVTVDSRCSSVLPVGAIADHLPSAAPAYEVDVAVRRLDALWPDLVLPGDVVALKIDTQGFEEQVLAGLGDLLAGVEVLEVEMALTPLYDGGGTLSDLLPRLVAAGFGVVSFDDGYVDPGSGQVLDVDVLMRRRR